MQHSGATLDFGRRQCSHLSLVVVDMVAALELVAAVTGKFTDFPVCVIRNTFIRRLSHLTISRPFLLINQKNA